jgi:hypothetical protein
MKTAPAHHPLDRYTEIGALSDRVRAALNKTLVPFAVILAMASIYLAYEGRPGTAAFALIGVGTCAALFIWTLGAMGLPLMPMFVIQTLVIYGMPILAGHEVILTYPPDFVLNAGVEVLVFDLVMAIAWKGGMMMFRPSPPICHALQEFNSKGVKGWARLGFGMVAAATAFEVLQGLGLTDALFAGLPSGVDPIVVALVSVVSACGFFLVSMVIGGTQAPVLQKAAFWGLLIANGMISASDFILFSAAANFITVAIGFFWSKGRIPWRYLTVTMLALSFFNTGKTTMRERYWENADSPGSKVTMVQLPAIFLEWIGASYDAILENRTGATASTSEANPEANKNQTLLDRVDNLQNLLFVIDAVKTDHVRPLEGATYTLIPPLLVPRVLWPAKPRAHEGQILLNVHFGRQDLNDTLTTYIAWGLLPEAYGNFGPIAGSAVLGCFLGLIFAWIENLTARKLVVSMEGFLALSLLMNLMNSFEMVASVLVTSTFQSMVIVVAASLPFVHRTANQRNLPSERRPVPDGS